MEYRHTETLLPEICQRERYGSIILQLLNMISVKSFRKYFVDLNWIRLATNPSWLDSSIGRVGRLLRPDVVQFHFACLGTEIFLRELTLSSTLSSNPKSSRSV